jgi:hypothetical protein
MATADVPSGTKLYILKPHCWCNGCVLASSAVDHVFESRSGQMKDYKIYNCCFSTTHAVLKSMNKTQNQDNVYKWGNIIQLIPALAVK